ncbi:ArpU family phage packaging/lysis transcriptional regulator [Lactobacillus johnsonii]|uniref:ArpU family phage packaging/lysis transcriptional regulator n=1 Tax=Lactobacillus johnsonii TaxID=33959 RepID=UPI003F510500
MSLLFKELDCDKTCDRVDEFLTEDLEKLILMSGRNLTDLRSPTLSLAPGHSNGTNHAEASIVRGLNAEAELRAIHHTIYHLPEMSKIIMRNLYIYQMESWQVADAIRYGHTQFNTLKRRAQLFFADSFDHWQRYMACSPIIDLHEYKQPETDRNSSGEKAE